MNGKILKKLFRDYVIAWLSDDGNKLAQDLSKIRGNSAWSKISEKIDGVDDDDLIYRVNLAALKKELGAK